MKIWTILQKYLFAALLTGIALSFALPAATQTPAAHKTENVIVVMLDGLRWQEVFRGADPELLKTLGPEALGDAQGARRQSPASSMVARPPRSGVRR
jgi:hypothetical protein